MNMGEHFCSCEIIKEAALTAVWDPAAEFPSPEEMRDLDIVTHVAVNRAERDGYHFLLEASMACHNNKFYMCWANHRRIEEKDNKECLVRGSVSRDGLHWDEAKVWMEAPLAGAESYNHPLLFSHEGVLYAYVAAWYQDRPVTHVFTLNDETEEWEIQEDSVIKGFVPFCAPQKLDDGNWIMSGSNFWYEAAVTISKGDNLTDWEMITIPRNEDFKLIFPETSVIKQEGRLRILCRPYEDCGNAVPTASVSESYDNGRTWTPLTHSNFPMSHSMPYAGRLSTGQNYLLSNSLEEGRFLLTIALTDRDGGNFKRIFKVRHQMWPARRYFEGYNNGVTIGTQVGKPTEWSYPKAIEYDGKLYVAYAQGKEDCVLSIIPIEVLQDKYGCQ